MELKTLRYFVAIAQAGNMHKAAEQLRIAQPALSRQIKLLEAELGVILFDRLPRGVRLSSAGQSFLEDATHVLWAAEQARQRAGLLVDGSIGNVRVGLHGPAHRYPGVQAALRGFKERHPNVRLAIRAITSERQVAALLDDEIDVGFAYDPGAPVAPVRVQMIDSDRVMLALPDTHPLAAQTTIQLDQLRDQPFIAGDRESNRRSWDSLHAACASAGFSPRMMVEGATSEPVIASLVSAGLGIGFLPAKAAARSPANIVFREVAGVSTTVHVVCLSSLERRSPLAERFVAVIDDLLQSNP